MLAVFINIINYNVSYLTLRNLVCYTGFIFLSLRLSVNKTIFNVQFTHEKQELNKIIETLSIITFKYMYI